MTIEIRESPNVDSGSLFAGRGYYQRSARRANGDKVYITGDFQWEAEVVRKLLMKLARRHRLRMIEIAELAKLAAEEECLGAQLAVVEMESVELPSLGHVPEPEDAVDLAEAMAAYRHDVMRCASAVDDSSLETWLAIAANQYRWGRFWVVRHPSAAVREWFAEVLAATDELRELNRAKAERLVARRRANGQH